MKMDKSEVCPDISNPLKEKKARILASKADRRRFKPKTNGKYVPGAILELILVPKEKMTPKDCEDLCFRLNGAFAPLPQNDEEEKKLDRTVWDYMKKRTSNNISDIVDKGSFVGIWIAGESISVKEERNDIQDSREMVYPP